MLTLALETSGLVGGVALFREDVCLAEEILTLGQRHAQTLVPCVRDLLNRVQARPQECGLIAVSLGPGSFTGLRVGVVFAKTFAYATGCAAAGVDTLLCLANNAPEDVSRLQVVMNAQRQQQFLAEFERDAHSIWQPRAGVRIVNTDAWINSLTAEDVVVGPQLEDLEERLAGRCRVLDRSAWHPRAGHVARLGIARFQSGLKDDPWTLEPRYIRKSAAEEKWDATHSAP